MFRNKEKKLSFVFIFEVLKRPHQLQKKLLLHKFRFKLRKDSQCTRIAAQRNGNADSGPESVFILPALAREDE